MKPLDVFFTGEYTIPLHPELLKPSDKIPEQYRRWIQEIDVKEVVNGCGHLSKRMIQDFPELRVAMGVVFLENGFSEEHVWCMTKDGLIIDPSAKQYLIMADSEPAFYQELDRTKVELIPSGKCPNCGGYYYPEDDKFGGVCSQTCFDSYARYLMSE